MKLKTPIRSVLVATNLYDMDWLFPFAIGLTQGSGARITLLHVVTGLRGMSVDQGGMPYYDPSDSITAAMAYLLDFRDQARAVNLLCDVTAQSGDPSGKILEVAHDICADVVILGTRSHRGIERWLLGSTAETVLRYCSVPVITIGPRARKAAASGKPINSILFATSLKGDSATGAELAFQSSKQLHARLTLLHVLHSRFGTKDAQIHTKEKELQALLPSITDGEDTPRVHLCAGHPSSELIGAAQDADLLIMGATPSPVLGRFAPEGTLYQVIAEAPCPVASFRSEPGRKPS